MLLCLVFWDLCRMHFAFVRIHEVHVMEALYSLFNRYIYIYIYKLDQIKREEKHIFQSKYLVALTFSLLHW